MNPLLEKYIAKVEKNKDKLPKRPCINAEMHTFGMCFHCEKSRGRNEALAEVQSLLPELIKEVVEDLEASGFVFGHREGDAFKQCSKDEVLASLKESNK